MRTKTSLPHGLRLLMGDVNYGSNTPSMVKSVLSWKERNPIDSNRLWERLDACNDKVNRWITLLKEFCESDRESYEATLLLCAPLTVAEWRERAKEMVGSAAQGRDEGKGLNVRVIHALINLRERFEGVRELMRSMGREAQVPIEPEEQTSLLDRTIETPGVVFAGVPGAGGFDAIFAVVIDPPSLSSFPHPEINVVAAVESVWSSFSTLSVLPQLLVEDPCGILLEDHHDAFPSSSSSS